MRRSLITMTWPPRVPSFIQGRSSIRTRCFLHRLMCSHRWKVWAGSVPGIFRKWCWFHTHGFSQSWQKPLTSLISHSYPQTQANSLPAMPWTCRSHTVDPFVSIFSFSPFQSQETLISIGGAAHMLPFRSIDPHHPKSFSPQGLHLILFISLSWHLFPQ